MSRVHPFPVIHPVYEHESSVYPDKVRVSMDDGKVIDYRIEKTEPESWLKPALDKFNKTCFGGNKQKDKGRGKRSGRRTNNVESRDY